MPVAEQAFVSFSAAMAASRFSGRRLSSNRSPRRRGESGTRQAIPHSEFIASKQPTLKQRKRERPAAHGRRVVVAADPLGAGIDLDLVQDLAQPAVERVTTVSPQMAGREPKGDRLRLPLAWRRIRLSERNILTSGCCSRRQKQAVDTAPAGRRPHPETRSSQNDMTFWQRANAGHLMIC